jgi:phosphoribosylformylglycinamidine synthase
MSGVGDFARAGGPVLGICNGFEVLLEAGLLPGETLRNQGFRFRCHPVYMRVESTDTAWTTTLREGQVLQLPIAHGEGNYFAPEPLLAAIEERRQVVFRYCDAVGRLAPEANPNGSIGHIAGVGNPAGNVVGLMPHPERASESALGSVDGQLLFESALAFLSTRRMSPAGVLR